VISALAVLAAVLGNAFGAIIADVSKGLVSHTNSFKCAVVLGTTACLLTISIASTLNMTLYEMGTLVVIATPRLAFESIIAEVIVEFASFQAN